MSKIIKLRKGLDVNLQGAAEKTTVQLPLASQYAVSPLDFAGVTPKLLVKAGDKVKAGTPLFFNKYDERVLFTSPVSGTVSAVNRGEKRLVLNVTIEADATQTYEEFNVPDPAKASREEIVALLLKSGLWPMIIQRPYGVIANPSDTPKAIFVSAFDSAPLAPDYDYVLASEKQNVEKGLAVLARLTDGKVHISKRNGAVTPEYKGAETHLFEGKHPAGNVGVQINHIDPINKGERVWTVNIQSVAVIGRFFSEGKLDMSKTVAVAGSEVQQPKYFRIINGAPIASILKDNVKPQAEGHSVRVISGNVLSGVKSAQDGYINFYADMLSVIPEGNHHELLGWIMPRFGKFSVSKTYFSWLFPKKAYALDTNLNGGERPFVVTGLYEQYLPMDIYPTYLLKAILAEDIDKMENLGIYEVIEEDLALCEFVDPSKIDMQAILRKGINLMIKEGE